ncbi:amidohydrolase/deacetylase family metallohydrolase [Acuticoccus sp. MNP-M23]|uniref:amidohydrolase/deacetylase family metallohydrolase n=1 Tax=Acuticoccus sp. MNP-M23 TaxID=3072793 RepID=UPI00281648ED|nr:amidohydrolase/deacetylase family metallohydrolase [Acuticoccus sp. MNP-M23]WMS43755.1 amidohydrolase/deacetylase family metallohydrolase [Acuticoccus sp. MNP-M23]
MVDLILRGGRVLDPAAGLDAVTDVAFEDGKIAAVGPDLAQSAGTEIRDVSGKIVTPGLIDLHTHVYWGGTSLGVDAPTIAKRSGTTTFVDAGSAGAGNFPGFRAHVIERTEPRILAYVNISYAGIFGFSKNVMVGECGDMRLVNPDECMAAAKANKDLVVGIKCRIGAKAGGASGIAPLQLAIEVADMLDLPVMAHIDSRPPSQKDVIEILRPGDVLTHCFRPWPNAPVDANRNVRAEVLAAKERGVYFDIGHGQGGFSFASCRAMVAEGILPDAISSDVHVLCVEGPAHDLLAVMSKFLALGMDLNDVVRCVTENPAKIIRRPELGGLAAGTPGDATVIELRDETVEHTDVVGEKLTGSQRLACVGTVIGGKWWSDGAEPA